MTFKACTCKTDCHKYCTI